MLPNRAGSWGGVAHTHVVAKVAEMFLLGHLGPLLGFLPGYHHLLLDVAQQTVGRARYADGGAAGRLWCDAAAAAAADYIIDRRGRRLLGVGAATQLPGTGQPVTGRLALAHLRRIAQGTVLRSNGKIKPKNW